jgi:hypothetical protein
MHIEHPYHQGFPPLCQALLVRTNRPSITRQLHRNNSFTGTFTGTFLTPRQESVRNTRLQGSRFVTMLPNERDELGLLDETETTLLRVAFVDEPLAHVANDLDRQMYQNGQDDDKHAPGSDGCLVAEEIAEKSAHHRRIRSSQRRE